MPVDTNILFTKDLTDSIPLGGLKPAPDCDDGRLAVVALLVLAVSENI